MSTVSDPWTTKVPTGDGGEYERPAPGMYPAVLVGLIHLGKHTHVFQGESKTNPKLQLVWELTGENDSNGKTFVVGQDYTWSLHAKARLTALIEGWLGLDMEKIKDFPISSLLGKECLITISEGQSGSGKKFSEIKGVGPVMRGVTVPPPTRQPFSFHLSELNSSADDPKIPDWAPRIYGRTVVDEIKASEEFGNLPPY